VSCEACARRRESLHLLEGSINLFIFFLIEKLRAESARMTIQETLRHLEKGFY
jgi:hypothetical protein